MDTEGRLELKRAFKKDIGDRSKEIDPDSEYEWGDLSYGYFLGKGCTTDEAAELSRQVGYEDEYFQSDTGASCPKCGAFGMVDIPKLNHKIICVKCGGDIKVSPLSEDRKLLMAEAQP